MQKTSRVLAISVIIIFSASLVFSQEASPSPSPSPTPTPSERIVFVPMAQAQAQSAPQIPISSQPPELMSNSQKVKEALANAINDQATKVFQSIKKGGVTTDVLRNGGGYYNFSQPPVVVELNKSSFTEGETFQSRLRVVGSFKRAQVSWIMLNLQTFTSRSGFAGTHVFVPGETITLQNYTWDGNEPGGLYIYAALLTDPNTGATQVIAVNNFVFRSFGSYDNNGYARVDSADFFSSWSPGSGQIHMRGNFFPSVSFSPLHQYVEVNGLMYPVIYSTSTDAWVNIATPPSGIYDIHLIVWYETNIVYDSVSAPSVLKIFNPVQYGNQVR